jgi:hypothetical protein
MKAIRHHMPRQNVIQSEQAQFPGDALGVGCIETLLVFDGAAKQSLIHQYSLEQRKVAQHLARPSHHRS